mgnify:CR=1 FL=1
MFSFFAGYTPAGVTMMTDIEKYLSFVLTMFVAFGITFEVPVIVVVLVRMRVVSRREAARDPSLRDRRRLHRRCDLHAARRDFAADARRAAVAAVRTGIVAGAVRQRARTTRRRGRSGRQVGSDRRCPICSAGFGRLPTVTSTSTGLPSRTSRTLALEPGCNSAMRASSCGTLCVGLPSDVDDDVAHQDPGVFRGSATLHAADHDAFGGSDRQRLREVRVSAAEARCRASRA